LILLDETNFILEAEAVSKPELFSIIRKMPETGGTIHFTKKSEENGGLLCDSFSAGREELKTFVNENDKEYIK
jgi:hypothetical protein